MPYPKGIQSPEVRAQFMADRQSRLAEYDRLRAAGGTKRGAASRVGVSPRGIDAMRRSVERLTESGSYHGGRGNQSIDIGLALLSIVRKPGESLTHDDIAAWCDCTRNAIWQIEQSAMRKLKRGLLEATHGDDLAAEIEELLGGRAL